MEKETVKAYINYKKDLMDYAIQVMEVCNFTQKEVAEKLNLSQGSVSLIINTEVRRLNIEKIAEFANAVFELQTAQFNKSQKLLNKGIRYYANDTNTV